MAAAMVTRLLRRMTRHDRASARRVARLANDARDAGRFAEAAGLYEASLDLWPKRIDLRVQAGHMRKESGDHARAERHYLAAAAALPDDADLALQLGHFYAVVGQDVIAAGHYRRALDLRPDWGEASRGLALLERKGVGLAPLSEAEAAAIVPERDEAIVRVLLPSPPVEQSQGRLDTIELRRLGGRRQRSAKGMLPVLSGVEAVRGICFSRAVFDRVTMYLDGLPIHAEPPVAFPGPAATKYVFNLWVDLSDVAPGLHSIEVILSGEEDPVRVKDHVIVTAPLPAAEHAVSDALLTLDPTDPRSIEAQVNRLPSVLRTPARSVLQRPVRAILVLRTDQLGDLVVSIPGLRRLRELFPEAHIVGLLTDANVDLARNLGLFDEAIAIPFPDDPDQRRRVMTAEDQAALRSRLAPYRFDVAIDLAISETSRPLLLLSGARYLYGFGDNEWPWLSAGAEGGTHDPKNDLEAAPQSGRIRALIERLGTIVDSGAEVIRRDDLNPARFAALGVRPGRYIVLHTGARIALSRWAGYPGLAGTLIRRTGLMVVLVTDDPALIAALPPELRAEDRFRLIDGRLDFEDFDTLISGCAVFVGNDSGPKHLASLRGVPVVSIHSARVNWNEWGQELSGTIISRRVPCARCALYHDPDECGKGFACMTNITEQEVLDAVLAQLPD